MRFTSQAESGSPVARESGRMFRGSAAFRSITCVIGVAWAMSGCSERSGSPVAPSSGSPVAPSAPVSPRAAPAITDIAPSAGSAGGGAIIKIVGTGFMPGMVAMFDGIKVVGRYDSRDTSFSTFYTETPAHAPGVVDLVVTNPDGQSHGLAGGYTYAPQESFDLNGAWGGHSLNGTDTWVEFVIQDNRLVSASCAYDVPTPFTFANFPTVANGEFSFTADGGAKIAGRIVAASEVLGTISFPPCTTTPLMWRANRKSQ
jgi:hypothetical protein